MRKLKLTGTLLIPLLSIIYGFGEIYHWWDILSGRQNILLCYERLSSGKGYPKSWIFEGENDFEDLKNYIQDRTKNSQIHQLKLQGKEPSLISVDGGGFIKWSVPKDWPISTKVPPESQILFIYGTFEKDKSMNHGKTTWVGSLNELNGWLNEDLEKQRFWVTIFLISILSLLFGLLEFLKK